MATLKTCFKCKQEKPLGAFYRHKEMADGHLGKCKECARSDVTAHRNKHLDRIREYDRTRPHRPGNGDWRKADPRRMACHNAVARAFKSGKLVKLPCFICGSEKSVAHHPSYDLPLAVSFLCQVHHKECHK